MQSQLDSPGDCRTANPRSTDEAQDSFGHLRIGRARSRCSARGTKNSTTHWSSAFIRQVSLSYKYESKQKLSIESDLAAIRTFAKILDTAHDMKVSVIPIYDTGPDATELMAENAAMLGCERVLIGSSRQGALYT